MSESDIKFQGTAMIKQEEESWRCDNEWDQAGVESEIINKYNGSFCNGSLRIEDHNESPWFMKHSGFVDMNVVQRTVSEFIEGIGMTQQSNPLVKSEFESNTPTEILGALECKKDEVNEMVHSVQNPSPSDIGNASCLEEVNWQVNVGNTLPITVVGTCRPTDSIKINNLQENYNYVEEMVKVEAISHMPDNQLLFNNETCILDKQLDSVNESSTVKDVQPQTHTSNVIGKQDKPVTKSIHSMAKGNRATGKNNADKVVKKRTTLKNDVLQKDINRLSVSEQLGISKNVDNSLIDVQWIRVGQEFKCIICEKLYKRLDKMRDHIRTHLGVKPFPCSVENCGKAYSTLYSLHNHIKRDHIPKLQCSQCKKFVVQRYFQEHQNTHLSIKPFQCKVCGKSFNSRAGHRLHVKKHDDPDNIIICEICGMSLQKRNLKDHLAFVHSKLRYHCSECNNSYSQTYSLRVHMDQMHNGGTRFKCEICSKTFSKKYGLNAHIQKHSSSLIECPKCDKVFKSQQFFEGHLDNHKGIRKYGCKVCNKRFAHRHYLHSHMKSHGEKVFICALCGGTFNRKDNLKSHILRHARNNMKKK